MATFPALKPSGRTFTPGVYPNTPFKAWNGIESRVRHSNVMLESSLRLTFTGITEVEMLSILAHYKTQRGPYESFTLPNDVLVGLSSISSFSPTGYRWCYTGSPQVTDLQGGRHTVELSLVTVPPEGAVLNGATLILGTTINGGTIQVSNGITASVTWILTPGQADAPVVVAGPSLSVTTSISTAGASGGVAVAGMDRTITLAVATESAATVVAGFGLSDVVEDDLLDLGF